MIILNTKNKKNTDMKAIELLKKLEEKPVFRLHDIQRIELCSRQYAILVLNRLAKRGLIKRVAENTYTTKHDINVIASNVTYPSYISFWYASYYMGYTEQIVNTVQVATTARRKSINFERYDIKFIPLEYFFGYRKIRTDEGDIFLAENEKLLIDALLRPKECGNFDEIEKMFENSKISEEKMIDYLKKIGVQTLIKRACFLLEKIKNIDLSREFKLDKNYVILNPFSAKITKVNSKWRLKL